MTLSRRSAAARIVLGGVSAAVLAREANAQASLSVTINSEVWSWAKLGATTSVDPGDITATASGGTAPYSYLWERVSGDTVTAATAASAATTQWSRGSRTLNTVYESAWRCKVTDSEDAVGYSSTIQVLLAELPG